MYGSIVSEVGTYRFVVRTVGILTDVVVLATEKGDVNNKWKKVKFGIYKQTNP